MLCSSWTNKFCQFPMWRCVWDRWASTDTMCMYSWICKLSYISMQYQITEGGNVNEPKVPVLRKQGEKSTTSYAEDQRYADQAAVRGEYTWNYKHDYDSRKR